MICVVIGPAQILVIVLLFFFFVLLFLIFSLARYLWRKSSSNDGT